MGTWGVGMPHSLLLEAWGRQLYDAFDEMPYLVGSALKTTTWRDVDVRMLFEDAKFAEFFGEERQAVRHRSARWNAFCLAFSAWGRQITGLPIDFQIQQRTAANDEYSPNDGHHRSALGIGVLAWTDQREEPE